MKRYISVLFLVFCSFFSTSQFTFSQEIVTSEDIEISKIKEQIAILQDRISQLEEIKKNKISITQDKKDIKIGLALSGGGAKGLAHIGLLRVLEELGIRPDYIAGTSMGAVVGTLYSVGYSLDEIERILTHTSWDEFVNGSFVKDKIPLEKKINNKNFMVNVKYDNKFNFSLPKGFGNSQMIYFEMKRLLSKVEDIKDFDKLPIPMRIIATDLNTGKAVAFNHGDLAKVVTASVSIPTLFDPIEIDGNLYVDGLVSRNFPVIDVIDMGADIVIGSDVGNEVKDKKDYNIISVLNQLVAIQSASSTAQQQKLATILITPDVLKYSATELDKGELFIKLGEAATREKIDALNSLPKSQKINTGIVLDKKNYVINNISFREEISQKSKDILCSSLNGILGREITLDELESNMFKLYGNEIVDTIYYNIEGDTLVLDVKINPTNSVGLGVNYLTGYGTTFDLGTSISSIGKVGNNSLITLRVGDYLGLNFKNFIYYGYSNKIGVFANLGYNENPFYLYSNNDKISDSLVRSVDFELGVLTQLKNSLTASYGITTSYAKLEQESGRVNPHTVEYSRNYNGAFLKTSYNTLDSNEYPLSGIKLDLKYSWEGSFDKTKSGFYGPLYTLDGYLPLSKNFYLSYGICGGMIKGDRVESLDRFIRLGGTKTNMQNKNFAFYGYNYQQRLVDEFFIAKLGLSYRIGSNLYLGVRWNGGTYNDVGFSNSDNHIIWEDYSQGFDFSLTYKSIFGPIEFSVSRDNDRKDILSQISIGYAFD